MPVGVVGRAGLDLAAADALGADLAEQRARRARAELAVLPQPVHRLPAHDRVAEVLVDDRGIPAGAEHVAQVAHAVGADHRHDAVVEPDRRLHLRRAQGPALRVGPGRLDRDVALQERARDRLACLEPSAGELLGAACLEPPADELLRPAARGAGGGSRAPVPRQALAHQGEDRRGGRCLLGVDLGRLGATAAVALLVRAAALQQPLDGRVAGSALEAEDRPAVEPPEGGPRARRHHRPLGHGRCGPGLFFARRVLHGVIRVSATPKGESTGALVGCGDDD